MIKPRHPKSLLCVLSAILLCGLESHADEVGAQPPVAEKKSSNARWEKEIKAFETSDKELFPPADAAVFVGSSSVRMWKTLAEDFAEFPTIRRGFGGSQLGDSVIFADRIILPYKPRIVVVYAGGNDLAAGKKPEDVLEQFELLAAKIHATLPDARIAYISINPSIKREAKQPEVRAANALIKKFVEGKPRLRFINSHDGLLGPDGKARKELLRADGLHLNAEGYKHWLSLVKPAISSLYLEAAPKNK